MFFDQGRDQFFKDYIPVYFDNERALRRSAGSSAWTTTGWSATAKSRPTFSLGRSVRPRPGASVRRSTPAETRIPRKIV
jgi:hypothetical protein